MGLGHREADFKELGFAIIRMSSITTREYQLRHKRQYKNNFENATVLKKNEYLKFPSAGVGDKRCLFTQKMTRTRKPSFLGSEGA